MPETSTLTILSAVLSEHINPYHLKTWLSLHFGKGSFKVKRYTGVRVSNADRMERKYEIWAPRVIMEVSTNDPQADKEAPFRMS
jgi:hypothetical protein